MTTTHVSRRRGAVAALVATVVVLASCGDGSTGDRLPSLVLPSVRDGAELDLGDLDGPAVVNLWATWCAPCRRELPDFEAVHVARAGAVRFVGVNIGDRADTAAGYLDELGITFEQYLDLDGELSDAIGAASLPVTIVLDGDGTISTQHIGPMDVAALEQAIEQAIG